MAYEIKTLSPWNLLPSPEPATYQPEPTYFYDKVAKHLLKDVIRIMDNGLPIDLSKVAELESTLDEVLAKVEQTLANNPIIKQYQHKRHKRLIAEYKQEQRSKLKSAEHFLKPFKPKDMNHRSYFMHVYAQANDIPKPSDLLPTGIPKWTARQAAKFRETHPVVGKLLDGTLQESNKFVKQALELFAQHKADIYNKKYFENIENPKVEVPPFNPSSPNQKRELFTFLGLESEATSKTSGEESWDRAQIERVNKETSDPDIREFTQAFIDHSFGAIVKNNFIKAFYDYTIDGRLYGSLRLFGAKSFRLTSQNPNLLNLPSTGSIYSKPVKQCFVAPPGYIVLTADYGALEDRVIASLSRDTNKCSIFTDGLDG